MLSHLQSIIADFGCIPKRLEKIISQYITFLMLVHKKHELRTASRIFGIHESNYSRMLSSKNTRVISRACLNRAIRRRLSAIKNNEEAFLIIDATLTKRSGKKIKNHHKFRHGGPYVEGHQFTNFVLLINDELVPLASVPFYSKKYCKEIGIHYRSEIDMVTDWIETLPSTDLLSKKIMGQLHFLLDSGYDAKCIQNAINDIGAKFTVGLRSERNVNGLRVKEYFQRHRHIPWRTIRFKGGNSRGKKQEQKFRIRSAERSHLKGFGEINVVCSEKTSRSARKTSRKYIATNNLKQSVRRTVLIYSKRWVIETWHKEMKQNHGYGDCRSQKFCAIESHINFCLCAYCFLDSKDSRLIKKGTTLDQYRSSRGWQHAAKVINLFGGREKLKALAHQEIAKVISAN